MSMRLLTFICFYFALSFLSAGCGFQLNRNQAQLPKQATNLNLNKIENSSFRPGIDLELRQHLYQKFANAGIGIFNSPLADLSLEFQIQKAGNSKEEFSLQEGVQSYRYHFLVQGVLLVVDQRDQITLINRQVLQAKYTLETAETDLEVTEVEAGFRQATYKLGDKILEVLTQDF